MERKLFDSEFLKRLEMLSFVARRVPRGGRHALQPSASKGGGVEFSDFRAYSPGEDMKSIDWNVYLRLGKLFLKLFTEELDLPLHILVDVSNSVFVPEERGIAAKKVAAAFAWVGISSHERVLLHAFSVVPFEAFGPVSNKEVGYEMLEWLERLGPRGSTGIPSALGGLEKRKGRKGLLVLISDFFQQEGLEEVFSRLSSSRHSLLLVQLVHPSDRDPGHEGEVRLVDSETGEWLECAITERVLDAYGKRYSRFQESIELFSLRSRALLFRVDAARDVLSQVESLFQGGKLRV